MDGERLIMPARVVKNKTITPLRIIIFNHKGKMTLSLKGINPLKKNPPTIEGATSTFILELRGPVASDSKLYDSRVVIFEKSLTLRRRE